MARGRGVRWLLLLALLAILLGTAAVLLRDRGKGPLVGGPHRIVRKGIPRAPAPTAGAPSPAAEGAPGEPAPADAPVVVRVKVVRLPAKEPVAGAEVFLQDMNCVWSARADAEGEVRFRGVEAGAVLVTARAPGLSGHPRRAQADAEPSAAVEVVLAPDVAVEGVVRSQATKEPIPGARVVARYDPGWAPGGDRDHPPSLEFQVPARAATTGADGRFRLEGLNASLFCEIAATAPGFGRNVVHYVPREADPSTGVEILLEPGGRILGRVRDREGVPVEGARVTAFPGAHSGAVPVELRQPGPAVVREGMPHACSGADGGFVIDGIPRDRVYQVTATRPGYTVATATPYLPEAPPEATCELVMDGAGDLLVDWTAEEGGPPPRGSVRVEYLDALGGGASMTALVGLPPPMRMTALRAVPVRVVVEAPGTGKGSVETEVLAGKETRVTVRLEAGISLEGVVLGPGGAPAPDVTVEMAPAPAEGRPARWTSGVLRTGTTTRADGTFRLGGLSPEGRWYLRAEARGLSPTVAGPFVAPASGLRIEMPAAGAVSGRVVLPPGAEPPPDLILVLKPRGPMGEVLPGGIRNRGAFGDGSFRIEEVPAGPAVLVVVAGRNEARDYLLEKAVEVPPGGVLALGDLAVAHGLELEVHVKDEKGAPVAGATVTAHTATQIFHASPGRRGEPLREGTLYLQELPEGEVEAYAEGKGFCWTHLKVVVSRDAPPVEIVLTRGGTLVGTVRDGNGVPLGNCPISLRYEVPREAASYPGIRVDARGRFEARLAPDVYHIKIHSREDPARVLAEATATIREGEETRLDLQAGR